jgi:hypothetical protein
MEVSTDDSEFLEFFDRDKQRVTCTGLRRKDEVNNRAKKFFAPLRKL